MLNPLSEADSWAQAGGNHNTERKTTSDLRRLSEWLRTNKGETRQPENIPPVDLDELLGAYFLDVRKLHNGDEYEPDSLAAIQRSIDRHLRGHSYCCSSIITDPRFKYSNECLLFKKKSLKAAGKGNRPNKAEPVSAEEVQFLLDKRLLGPYSAESLINSLWYVNTVHLGIKGQKGHTSLLWGDVEKKVDACGREYIEYHHERTSKTLSGRTAAGEPPRPSPEPPRAWGDPNNPLLCPVRLYDEYAKRRPPQSTYPTTRFYLSKYHGKRDDVWFIDIPMGKNTVGQIMKVMATKAYGAILNESGLNDLESRHLAKRAKQNDNGEGSSVSEDSSDGYEVVEDPPSNQMNNSLVSLYRKGNPDSAASSPKGEQSAVGSPATVSTPLARTRAHHPSAGTQVSAGGWFIDKRPEQNILIDLSEEDAASPAIKQEEEDVSMLEPRSTKTKGKLKKSKKRKGEETLRHGDIESSILNKKAKTKAPELQYSTVKFEDVGGNDATLTELCKLLIHMRHPEVYSQLGVVPPRGFLLHGPPGCGKTLMAQAVAGELELPMLKVSAPELVSGVSGESEQKLRELFDQAVTNAPCILFIDEIDSITPKREVASKDMERRIVAQLLTCMDDLNSLAVTAQVLVIGATNRPDSLDPALRRAGRFDREICLGIPDEAARLRILKTLCRKLKLPEDFDYRQLARLTPGYVGADLMALCREAAMCAVNRVLLENQSQVQVQNPCSTTDLSASGPLCTDPVKHELELVPQTPEPEQQGELARLLQLLKSTESVSEEQLAGLSILMTDFQDSLASVQPSAKREGFATVPDVTWEDVGALQDIREELTMAILAPVRSPEQFKALGLNAPAGVLLAGPPGCGKTLLAKAVANESGLNFISVKGPELLNMYVGESERAVRQVFQRGRNSAPCVIFFDEIDALCPRRSGHESGAGVRVVNQLLTEMDGLESRRQVFIMAATNRPDIIDPAVLRPGRLDKTLYVGLPPPQDRHAILLTITKGGTKPPLEQDVVLEEIAHDDRCDCFTGADLSALVREASVNALRAHLKSQCTPTHSGHVFSNGVVADIRVSKQNFEDAFTKVRPSVSKKDQRMYEQLRESLSR